MVLVFNEAATVYYIYHAYNLYYKVICINTRTWFETQQLFLTTANWTTASYKGTANLLGLAFHFIKNCSNEIALVMAFSKCNADFQW